MPPTRKGADARHEIVRHIPATLYAWIAIEATIMIWTASTVSDTKWKIIAAAIAEKAKPTVLERLAATKITIDTATHKGASCATSARPYRDQPRCQAPAPTVVMASKTSVTRPILRPSGGVAKADMTNPPTKGLRWVAFSLCL